MQVRVFDRAMVAKTLAGVRKFWNVIGSGTHLTTTDLNIRDRC